VINAANDYIKKKDWDVAARSLQYLLEKPEDSFFAVTKKKPDGTQYTTRISIRLEANRMIGELPTEGLEVYRQKFGAKAKQMLEEGIARNDPQQLSLVAMRYRHTEAGNKAIQWLADHFLDRGNYQSAAGQFQQLLDLLESEKPEVRKELGPKLWFKAALAYQRLGNPKDAESAKRLFKLVEESVGEKGLVFGNQTYTVDQLKAEFDRNAKHGALMLNTQFVYRGDASRTAQGIGGEPFLSPRMTVQMTVPQKDKEADATWMGPANAVSKRLTDAITAIERTQKGRPLLPGFFPLAGQNRVIFRTYDGVYAFFIRDDQAQGIKAGEIAWMQPTKGSLHAMSQADTKGILENWAQMYQNPNYMYGGGGPIQPNNGLGLYFENAQVGSLSHDGQLVYFVDDLAVPPPPMTLMNGGFGGPNMPISNQEMQDKIYCNTLWAVELESGLLRWQVGARKLGAKPPELFPGGMPGMARPVQPGAAPGGEKPKAPEPPKPFVPPTLPVAKAEFVNAYDELLDTYFLGPPLPLNGLIYALAENAGEIQLICINPNKTQKSKTNPQEDGPELLWRQPLGTANNKLAIDVLRRVQPAHLSYSDGKLICPTNAGAIIAVDVYTRSLSWAHSYRMAPKPQDDGNDPNGFRRGRIRGGFDMGNLVVNFNQDRWQVSAPAVINGRVVFTAPDAGAIQCLSLKDGEVLWSIPRAPKDLYFAGVFNGKVLIVGKDSARALDLADGKTAWEKKIGLPSGQGVCSNNTYFLPLKYGLDPSDPPEVCAIDVNTGEMHHTKSRKFEVPGNLIFHEGDVLSQNIWTVSAFPQLQMKLAEMNQRLKANPKDPVGLLERGEMHLDKGKDHLPAAVDDLKASLQYDPPPDVRKTARAKLYDALTELLQLDFTKAEPHLPLYRDLCLNEVTADEKIKRQSNYLCIVGGGKERQGKLGEAFDAYMEFGQLNGGKELVPSIDDPGTLSAPDVWARGRIVAMLEKAKPEDKKPLEERMAEQWKQVQSSGDVQKIRGFVKLFGSSFAAGKQARLQLAETLLKNDNEDDQREAQIHLYELAAQHGDRDLAAKAIDDLASLMIRKKLLEDAVYYYRQLGTDFADVKVRDGKTGAEIYNELITEKRFLPYLEPAHHSWNQRLRGDVIRGQNAGVQQNSFSFEPEGELLPFFARHRLVMDMNPGVNNGQSWQFRAIDRVTGADVVREPYIAANPQFFANPQAAGNFHVAQARGHLLVLTSGTMVYGFDLAAKGEKKKLWEFNLLGKGNSAIQVVSTVPEADGTLRQIYADGYKQRIGALGIFESSYVCVSTRDGLVAMDPLKGPNGILWTKEASSGVQLFGDDSYVFVVELNDNGTPSSVKAVRASDGVSVDIPDCRELLQPAKKLRTLGRNILVFDDAAGGGKRLRLYDPLTGKDLWSKPFPAGSLPVRSRESLTGVIEPSGALTLLDANSQKVVLKTTGGENASELPGHLSGIHEVQLLSDRERYYLILNKSADAGIAVNPGVTNAIRCTRVHGHIYAYDKASGEIEYFADAANQFLVLEQFQDLPVLILTAFTNKFQQNGVDNSRGHIMAFDKKSGRAICDESINPAQFYAMTVDFNNQMIELVRHDVRVRFVPEGSAPSRGAGAEAPATAPQPVQQVPLPAVQIRMRAIQLVPAAPAPPPAPPKEEKKK
ncbi:MAG: PQQ-binding-like beta-propeller repeat protein, partial [Gemmataceae bacterium]